MSGYKLSSMSLMWSQCPSSQSPLYWMESQGVDSWVMPSIFIYDVSMSLLIFCIYIAFIFASMLLRNLDHITSCHFSTVYGLLFQRRVCLLHDISLFGLSFLFDKLLLIWNCLSLLNDTPFLLRSNLPITFLYQYETWGNFLFGCQSLNLDSLEPKIPNQESSPSNVDQLAAM